MYKQVSKNSLKFLHDYDDVIMKAKV